MTNPSRSESKGMDTHEVDSAVILEKPATPRGERGASLPPATITSQRPVAMSRPALAMLWVPAAQAVTVVSHGPRRP